MALFVCEGIFRPLLPPAGAAWDRHRTWKATRTGAGRAAGLTKLIASRENMAGDEGDWGLGVVFQKRLLSVFQKGSSR